MQKTRWLVLGAVVLIGGMALAGSAGCTQKEQPNLPLEVSKAFKAEFPNGQINETAREKKGGVSYYDIDFKDGAADKAANIAANGTILSVAVKIDPKEAPEAAMKAIQAAAEGGQIELVEKIEVRCEPDQGKITKLAEPKTRYGADLKKGNLAAEIVVDDKGTVVDKPSWSAVKEEPAKDAKK
jgi:hypothetical protein